MVDNDIIKMKWANAIVFDSDQNYIYHRVALGQPSIEKARQSIQEWEDNKGYVILSYWITDYNGDILESKVFIQPSVDLQQFSGHTIRLSSLHELNDNYRSY